MKHILFLAALALIGAGCAQTPSAALSPTAAAAPKRLSSPRFWRLTFDRRLEQNDFAAPILNVDFGDDTLPFLVNTGVRGHIIDNWAAQEAKLPVDRGLAHLSFEISNDKRGPQDFRVQKLNTKYEQNGVAGSLSPQLLIEPDQAIALDFFNSKFYHGPFEVLMSQQHATLVSDGAPEVCASETPGEAPLYLLMVKVDDIPLRLLMDSSAEGVSVIANQPAAEKLNKEGAITFFKQRRGKVSIGGKTVTRLVTVLEKSALPCNAEGVVGMDTLKLCTIVLDQKRVGLNCLNN